MTESVQAWAPGWRSSLAGRLEGEWDLCIIGGGITGAGIFREACRRGLRTVLLEQNDFASGTSSRSSKLVHGGLRYLGTREWRLTVHSVREREHLLREGAGLVERQGFVLPVWRGQRPGWWSFRAGLAIYDRIAGKKLSRTVPWDELRGLAPDLSTAGLRGALYMEDAQTDDARLVLRLLHEGQESGGLAVNYCRVSELLHADGRVAGVRWQADGSDGELRARVVVNASGAWAARHGGSRTPQLRPLRGSHLVFSSRRLPLPAGLSWLHPSDRRPVFAYSWLGVSLIGTTDLDHEQDLDIEPRISAAEAEYLLVAARQVWPRLGLGLDDVISTYAGVRPVVSSGADRPSDEPRESALWSEPGLVGITGGKLTTFRLTALEVLAAVAAQLGQDIDLSPARPILDTAPQLSPSFGIDAAGWQRLCGRHGHHLSRLLDGADAALMRPVGDSDFYWAELAWAAAGEAVEHLDDLLFRRTRLGLVLGAALFEREPDLRAVCQPALGWDDARWTTEFQACRDRWAHHHSVPE